MFEYLRSRYAPEDMRIRGLAHGMWTGLITALAVTLFGPFGFLGLLNGLAVEIKQALRSIPGGYFDGADAILDLCEHTLGGILIGGLFYLIRSL